MTTTSKKACFLILLAAAGLAISACKADSPDPFPELAGVKQFVANSSFEEMDGESPRGWRIRNWQRRAEFTVESFGRTGERAVLISSEQGADASWITAAPIRPFSRYKLSGWIKTEDLDAGTGRGALINVHGFETWRTPSVTGTEDWTRVEVEFEAGANDVLEITCLFGGWGRATGKAWYDDIQLEWLSGRDLGRPEVTIDADKTLVPMSELIYGQFIEHLGRCIYQGIWAEMLEDRKFFWPVGDEESPWRMIGDPDRLRMNDTDPFVGEHSPRIGPGRTAPAGISQEGLSLVQGRKYVGRVVLRGGPGASPLSVRLVWGDGPEMMHTITIDELGREYRTYPLQFQAEGSAENARLEIVSSGGVWFEVGTVSLMPADNVDGFRPDVLALLRELDSPIYRWPGGNFVSGYDWKDGIGNPDKRPPRKNPAWQGVEHNDVGIHEYLHLMSLLDAEPFITVNSGLGDVTMAIEEVEYVNGAGDTPMGKVRALNGHPEPWGVTYWAVGNEMYGSWQLGHMPLSDYVRKHTQFAVAMKAVDPSVKLVAVGAVGRWSRTMLAEASNHMDYISEHFYRGEKPGLLSHVNQIPSAIRNIAEAHREYRRTVPSLQRKEVPIALDEWNYWYGPYVYGELGTQYFLQDALGIAAGFHEYARQSDMYVMANYAQTVNVIGAIKTSKTDAVLDTTGLVLKLYRHHFGTIPVEVTGKLELLDVMACWGDGRRTLTVAIVNPTRSEQTLKLRFNSFKPPKKARLFLITGDDPKAGNVPGEPPAVSIQEVPDVAFGKTLSVAPISVSLYELDVK